MLGRSQNGGRNIWPHRRLVFAVAAEYSDLNAVPRLAERQLFSMESTSAPSCYSFKRRVLDPPPALRRSMIQFPFMRRLVM